MNSKNQLRIVIVEDNHELRQILTSGLRHFGHLVRDVGSAQEVDDALRELDADFLILDLGLAGEDGISIAKRLRRNYRQTLGIVMVTARGRIEDRVMGLEVGADLYFVKPVDIRELEAALRSLKRRIGGQGATAWRFNAITSTLSTPRRADLSLTAQECILLRTLLKTPGENVSRQMIFQALRQPDDQYADKRLEAMISRLRRKLKEVDPATELPIRARHNLGYAFLAEIE